MTHDEMKQEKLAMQKALIYFENLHGRPVSIIQCCMLFSVCQSQSMFSAAATVFVPSAVLLCLKFKIKLSYSKLLFRIFN